jgi:hypothetical protein
MGLIKVYYNNIYYIFCKKKRTTISCPQFFFNKILDFKNKAEITPVIENL